MIIAKLLIVLVLLVLFIFLSIRLARRGLSKRYEPRSKTPWNSLSEGEDPSV